MAVGKAARTRLLRWMGGGAAVAALSVVGMLAVAAPASAASSDCQSGRTCVWKDAGYSTGGFGNIQYSYVNGIDDFRNYSWGIGQWGNLDKKVTSVYNNGNTQQSSLSYGYDFTGIKFATLSIKSGLPNVGSTYNDKASSGGFQWCYENPSSYICA